MGGLRPSLALGTKLFRTKLPWNFLKSGLISPKMGVFLKGPSFLKAPRFSKGSAFF